MITLEKLDYREALRYMGFQDGKADPNTLSMLEECEKSVLENSVPRYRYGVFDISETENGIVVGNTDLILQGNAIRKHLENCFAVVLMCATISGKIDALIRRTQLEDMSKAIIINSFSSVAVEQLCDKAETEIYSSLGKLYENCYKTWRFSPGYDDLPLSHQKTILDILDTPRKIGVCTNESHTLTPIKSVTAIIGLSHTPVAVSKRGCVCCRLKNTCPYRKAGHHCAE